MLEPKVSYFSHPQSTMSHLVKIELQRVQSFLFAVPRLADIVGANAMLGETIRYDLVAEALLHRCQAPLPKAGNIQGADTNDPLGQDKTVADDPCALWQQGILSRDGGHFHAHFASKNAADRFAQAAQIRIRRNLPGLRCKMSVQAFNDGLPDAVLAPELPSAATALFSLPLLQQCQEAGNGPATKIHKYPRPDGGEEAKLIGQAAQQRKIKWRQFKRNQTKDIAALMSAALRLPPTETFEALCGTDYLALIHADGNGLGKAAQAAAEGKTGLEREAAMENFFHTMRVTLRRALMQAVDKLYEDKTLCGTERAGLQILMLGGDDLLLACRAPLALPLVRCLAQALADIQKPPSANAAALTLGVGVAIAKPAFPFHRLHDLAEELAASAKRLVRTLDTPVSVIDWAVCSEAWFGDLTAVRRSAHLLSYRVQGAEETLALSAKPYPILCAETAGAWSLAGLLASQTHYGAAARSQLRALVRTQRQGRRQAESALLDVQITSPETWNALTEAGFVSPNSLPLLWQAVAAGVYLSHFADWVEISEIARLQTQPQDSAEAVKKAKPAEAQP